MDCLDLIITFDIFLYSYFIYLLHDDNVLERSLNYLDIDACYDIESTFPPNYYLSLALTLTEIRYCWKRAIELLNIEMENNCSKIYYQPDGLRL